MKVGEVIAESTEELKEIKSDLNNLRKQINKDRKEFETVKKARYDKFTSLFTHVCDKIDDIYKASRDDVSIDPNYGIQYLW